MPKSKAKAAKSQSRKPKQLNRGLLIGQEVVELLHELKATPRETIPLTLCLIEVLFSAAKTAKAKRDLMVVLSDAMLLACPISAS